LHTPSLERYEMQLYEDAEIEFDENDPWEEIRVKLMVMDDGDLLIFGDWLDNVGMMFDDEMRSRKGREGH
jgi:hypothetical protein